MPSTPASILVVDDNDPTRNVMVRILQRSGHRPTPASSGFEAVKAVEAAAFDLVLLDLEMPGMDGAATATALRALRPEIRIAFVSGSPPSAAPPGGLAFIQKPFTQESLANAVRELLEPSGS